MASTGSIFIHSVEGELTSTLTPGVSREVGGVRVVLDSVEFGADATTVHVRAIPPGYHFPAGAGDGPVMPPMSIMPFRPAASYQLNKDPSRPAGGGGFRPRVHEVEITWRLDPVPASTNAFRFVVTSLGKFDGPWEFALDLR